MFYYLDGQVAEIGSNFAVLDIGGAGYGCFTTMNTISRLETGKRAKLYTYCHIKEDAFDIYGFYDLGEKRCFEMLLTVSGVGPKAALSILSAVTPENLMMAIISENDKALTAAPGIGKRIAQRIILELKDKVAKENAGVAATGAAIADMPTGVKGGKINEVGAALSVLGYSQAEINAALRNIDIEGLSVEEIIRQILRGSLK